MQRCVSPVSSTSFADKVDQTIESLIEQSKKEGIGVDRLKVGILSQSLGLDSSTLRRKCLKYLAQSPKQYFDEYRINKAKSLLSQGLKPSKVADMLGFSEHKVFSQVFKKIEGVCPCDYLH